MPQSHLNWADTLNNRLISQQLNYDPENESFSAHHLLSSLTVNQRNTFNQIWQSIMHKQGKTFFIDGFGGCGKTYLYQTVCHAVRAQGLADVPRQGVLHHARYTGPVFIDGLHAGQVADDSLRSGLQP